ncbi:MAG: lysoplasmalogenase [Planctomycetales bacterium]|nr:lysoplasmalogenase [Planctomycetales bacterium]
MLQFFWIAWAGLLTAGLIADRCSSQWFAALETEFKAVSSVALVGFAWTFAALALPSERNVARLIAIGMTLGSLGDASPLLGSSWPDPQRTIGNMILFGLGHVAYIRANLRIRQTVQPSVSLQNWRLSLAFAAIVSVASWYFAALSGLLNATMKYPALPYTCLLSVTTGVSIGTAIATRGYWPVALGTVLFLTSDLLLAIWIFHGAVYRTMDLVWLTYGIGQMLIVVGTSRFLVGHRNNFVHR